MKSDAAGDWAIETCGLTKRFARSPRAVVEGLDVRVPRGSVFGFIGLNGAGKSTTIRMLMGLLPPSSGGCLLNRVDPHREPVRARRGVGYVPDRLLAYSWMRVGQLVEFCAAMQPRWDGRRIEEALKSGGIDPRQRVSKLSKGMAARLSLILALGHDPDVLILDEPTDGLDPIARDEFLESVIGSVCDRGRTVLMSSHSLRDVEKMADVIGLIHEGRMLVQARTEDLLAGTKRIRAVVDEPASKAAAAAAAPGLVWSRIEGRQWTLTVRGDTSVALEHVKSSGGRNIDVQDMSLDDIFRDVVRGHSAGSFTASRKAAACS
jgi:ABC-2 type transport system ATP-binding protein